MNASEFIRAVHGYVEETKVENTDLASNTHHVSTFHILYEMEDLEQCSVGLRKTLEECYPPVHLSVLMRAYRMENGREVPYEQYGYTDAADFLRENFPELSLVKSDRGYIVHLKSQTASTEVNSVRGISPQAPTTSSVTTNVFTLKQWTRQETGKTKAVPIQFRTFLARILEQYPFGISARDFVDVFYKTSGSPLSYKLYGYPGHLSMFKDLPDVFRIEQVSENEHKLFPLQKSDSRPLVANETRLDKEVQGRNSEDGAQAWAQTNSDITPPKAPISNGGLDPVKKWATPLGTLVTVSLEGNVLVPTGCLASMIGLNEDDVLLRLKQQGIDVRGVKFLSNEIPEHSLLLEKLAASRCPSLLSEDGRPVCVISLVPFESCCFILNAFSERPTKLQKQADEIRGIIEALEAS